MPKIKIEVGDKVRADRLELEGIVFKKVKVKGLPHIEHWSRKARRNNKGRGWKYYIAYYTSYNSPGPIGIALLTGLNIRFIGRASTEELLTHPGTEVRMIGLERAQT